MNCLKDFPRKILPKSLLEKKEQDETKEEISSDKETPFYCCEMEMSERMQRAIDRFDYYSKNLNKIDKQEWTKFITELRKEVGPSWYQELSDGQMVAADRLYEEINYDMQQGTVHRILRLLRLIGICPIVNGPKVNYALELSRGNDIAFLWYLMKLFYESSCPQNKIKKYTVNERIIMSVICHLDMIPTLRELDKILPPLKPKVRKCKRISFKTNCKYESPYLEPLTNIRVPHSKVLPPPNMPVSKFGAYERYKDPNFMLQSESNRWYGAQYRNPTTETPDPNLLPFNRQAVLDYICHKNKVYAKRKNKQLKVLFKTTRCHCKDLQYDAKYILAKNMINPMEMDNAKCRAEYKKLGKLYRKQTIVKIIFRNIIKHLPTMQNIKICKHNRQCVEDYGLYMKLLERNQCRRTLQDSKKQCAENKKSSKSPKAKYEFDYEKIFRKSIFLNPCKESLELALELDKYATEENSLTICFRNFWKLETQFWGNDMEDISDDDCDLPECNIMKPKKKKSKTNQEEFYISSTDPKLMKRLLKDGIRKLRENPKFVLATMPHVYDLKLLQEWILVRYGHVYTRRDRLRGIVHSYTQWNILLTKNIKRVTPMGVKSICDVDSVDYDFRQRIGDRINYKFNEYHRELNIAMINYCRLFWPTMAPYLCPNGCPREVFYAYMPASEYEILSVRPWNKYDLRQMKKNKCLY